VRVPEPYRALARKARRKGWTITTTGGGHLAWTSPSGAVIYTPSSPSESRGYLNTRAQFRRAGLAA
jgi:hypothetical protein